jgi:gas vesicle protein
MTREHEGQGAENLRKINHLAPFLVGFGLGITASLLLAPQAGRNTRNRIRDVTRVVGDGLEERAESLCDEAADVLSGRTMTARHEEVGGEKTLNNIKDKAKDKIGDAADGGKNAADKVVDKSKDFAHSASKKMEEGGKLLQDA